MSAHWKSYPDAVTAAEACATHIQSLLEMALAGDSDATIAFSGGETPKPMFAALAKSKLQWSRIQVFFVDERMVHIDDADSNYRMITEHLIRPARIPIRNIHRVHTELAPPQAARHYEAELRDVLELESGEMPHFDVLHLGVGTDAHTASLFPNEPLIDDREHIVAAVHVHKLSQWRVTLLPGVLLAARHAAVLVSGGGKAEAMRNIIRERYSPREFPAQIVAHHSRRATWFLDQEAARLLD